MEQAIREFIKQHGKAAFDLELRRVLTSQADAEFESYYGIERSAFPAEIRKIFAENSERGARSPMPDLIHHGHYLVKSSSEIILVSAPCALDRQVTEDINGFCRENEWNYEVRPAADPHDADLPLRVVFHTGFFVSPG